MSNEFRETDPATCSYISDSAVKGKAAAAAESVTTKTGASRDVASLVITHIVCPRFLSFFDR